MELERGFWGGSTYINVLRACKAANALSVKLQHKVLLANTRKPFALQTGGWKKLLVLCEHPGAEARGSHVTVLL